jgi:glycine/D-amino acid oxidase-like deaminating enzyme
MFLDGGSLRNQFPFVSEQVVGGLHARTAGWLSAQQLGTWLLEEAETQGARFLRSRVVDVFVGAGKVAGVTLNDGSTIPTKTFVNAAGPMLADVGRMVGVDLPVHSEVHAKSGFRDHLNSIPRMAPMIIWNDPQQLTWTGEERDYLDEESRTDLTGVLPPGCHARPEGGPDSQWALGLWEYHTEVQNPVWPIPTDPLYTEVVLRGLATMVPALRPYQDRLPEAVVDAGYYTRTRENRPLAGPAGPEGSFVCGALSGFGIMAACGVGELVATAITGGSMPDWAPWFDLRRYDNAEYVAEIASLKDSGQL